MRERRELKGRRRKVEVGEERVEGRLKENQREKDGGKGKGWRDFKGERKRDKTNEMRFS